MKSVVLGKVYPYLVAFPEENAVLTFWQEPIRVSILRDARSCDVPNDGDVDMVSPFVYNLNVKGRKYRVILWFWTTIRKMRGIY